MNIRSLWKQNVVHTYLSIYPSPSPHLFSALVGCGGHFSTEQGELKSANWPSDYPNQAVCTWWVSVPSAKAIHITFTHFDVQAANRLGQCVDYVEIFSSDMKSLGKSKTVNL